MRRIPVAVLPGAVLFVLARLPSLLEPHWYTDEAGYASTAMSLLRGRALYSGIWTNKPPLHIALVALPVAIDQRSELLLHLLSFAFGATAMAAAALIAVRLLTPARAAVALVVAAVFLGSPVLEAQLVIPESLYIAPASCAAALVLMRLFGGEGPATGVAWAAGAGALAAAAVAIQQTSVVDACALGLILLVSPRATRSQRVAYAAAAAGLTLSWLLVVVVSAGAGTVAYALAGYYVQYSAPVLPGSAAGLGRHLAAIAAVVALVAGSAVLLRRSPQPSWALAVWSAATLAVPALAQQPYAHFLTPTVIPGALLLASVPAGRVLRPARLADRLAAGAAALALVVALVMARSAGLDWILPDTPLSVTDAHTVPWYYGVAVGRFSGQRSTEEWEDGFDPRSADDDAAAEWITAHGLAGHSAVLWASDVWVHMLADLPVLMPTAPIYNDEVLLGFGGPVADRVAAISPELVVTQDGDIAAYPEITPLLRTRYRMVSRSGGDAVWLRTDLNVASLAKA